MALGFRVVRVFAGPFIKFDIKVLLRLYLFANTLNAFMPPTQRLCTSMAHEVGYAMTCYGPIPYFQALFGIVPASAGYSPP